MKIYVQIKTKMFFFLFFEFSCMTMHLLKLKRKLFEEQSSLSHFNNGNQEANQITKNKDSNKTTKARKRSEQMTFEKLFLELLPME